MIEKYVRLYCKEPASTKTHASTAQEQENVYFMKLYFLGIGGTLVGHLAVVAKQMGHTVLGFDEAVYPPMSTILLDAGITFDKHFNPSALKNSDLIIVGNKLARGNACVEFCLSNRLPIVSSAQWLYDNLLVNKTIIAVAGTHGKTTTSALLAWALTRLKTNPSYLIAGDAKNFSSGIFFNPHSSYFVIEADEYDTCFFDKRSKFVHYQPDVLLINNLEFDHADIFTNLKDIQQQFHQLIRRLPKESKIIYPHKDTAIEHLLSWGCWSQKNPVDTQQECMKLFANNHQYTWQGEAQKYGPISCAIQGAHNQHNMVMALHVLVALGVSVQDGFLAMDGFLSVARRMEQVCVVKNIEVYLDFAHHPTSVKSVLSATRQSHETARVHVLFFAHNNTLKTGHLTDELIDSLSNCDNLWLLEEDSMSWRWSEHEFSNKQSVFIGKIWQMLCRELCASLQPSDCLIVMSNGNIEAYLQDVKHGLEQRFLP